MKFGLQKPTVITQKHVQKLQAGIKVRMSRNNEGKEHFMWL